MAAAGVALTASGARAIEALDGRLQFHGYAEMQLRALDEKFSQELDLSQWYNVLNLELEFDIAPDGIGPINLMSAYVRAEARYDAIYNNGFYMFPSIDTYGDASRNLPKRLRDAETKQMGGVIKTVDRFGQFKTQRITNRDPFPIAPPVQTIPNTNIDVLGLPGGIDNPLNQQTAQTLYPDGLNVAKGGPDELTADGRQSDYGMRRGYPGFDTFFTQAGPDNQFGTADDPARYVMRHVRDFEFTFKDIRGPLGNDTMIMGPWLPKNFITANALNTDRGNPFRGRIAPTPPMLLNNFFINQTFGDAQIGAIRFHEGDLVVNPTALKSTIPLPAPGELSFAKIDVLDPALLQVLNAPGQVPTNAATANPNFVYLDLRGFPVLGGPNGGAVPALLSATFPGRWTFSSFSPTGVTANTLLTDDVGGDFMGGIVPCVDPTVAPANHIANNYRAGTAPTPPEQRCISSSSFGGGPGPGTTGQTGGTPGNPPNVDPGTPKGSFTPPGLTQMTGGFSQIVLQGNQLVLQSQSDFHGETPFRPAPDLPNLGQRLIARDSTGALIDMGPVPNLNQKHDQAQGLYIPSKGALREINSNHLDSLDFNFDETDRSWNHGQAQQENKELKEAYTDIEVLDSRLWMRLGLQNIVWGKTELFRTTDQFNPQDLALSSIPSLEESRIALWSARFVYSLYDIGPLEDVRLEFATNIDKYQPDDLGACGEPYTPDIVCSLTNGIFAHGLVGIGVIGIDRPEAPWKKFSDLEFGGRLEWRWDRFSFALMDFWGFSDFPHPEAQWYYSRSVDTDTGRPLVGVLPTQQPGKCGVFAGESAVDNMNTTTGTPFQPSGTPLGISYNSSFASHPFSVTTGAPVLDPLAPGFTTLKRGGIGRDPDCLRPGGAPGSPNAFAFDQDILSQTNALYNHSVNQQIFAWICAGTIGIAASLDAGSCAWTIFASNAVLQKQLLPISFVESLTTLFAGEQSGSAGPPQFMSLIANNLKNTVAAAGISAFPLASLNMLYNNPNSPFDRNHNGVVDRANCNDSTNLINCDLGGFDGFDGRVQINGRQPAAVNANQVTGFISLDQSLTNEQRALLGCGPFYGSRCDSSLRYRDTNRSTYFGSYGGLDFMNMEASALVQSWPGVEGTVKTDTTTSNKIQPGTVGWVPTMDERGSFNNGIGGPICTRFVMSEHREVKLPGCRGVQTLTVTHTANGDPVVLVSFEQGYLPSIDGCVIGTQINNPGHSPVQVVFDPNGPAPSAQLRTELGLCNGARTKEVQPRRVMIFNPDGTPATVNGQPQFTAANPCNQPGNVGIGPGAPDDPLRVCNAKTVTLQDLPLFHPTAGCVASGFSFQVPGATPDDCRYWMYRNYVQEFFNGTAQLFQNELAAFSWNFLMFLTLTSCNLTSFDLDGNDHLLTNGGPRSQGPGPQGPGDPNCYDPNNPYTKGRCSIATPEFCSNVKGFLTAAGVEKNTALAGGNNRFGRRTFIWDSGGELTLDYQQRNVLGFSSDFAEDHTKTNWGVEFTWIGKEPYQDNASLVGSSQSQSLNMTVSVDRPTFINFLNPNRTFFFNSQWFFSYLTNYHDTYNFNGPFNVLFTFAVFTGYFQDRVQPQLVTIYDFKSQSGGLLPSFQYRFTDSFSVTIGTLYFFGRTQLKDMPTQDFAPAANRSGANAYENGVDNLLSLIRQRDEVFMRLRYTF